MFYFMKIHGSAYSVSVVMASYFICRDGHHALNLMPYDAFPGVKSRSFLLFYMLFQVASSAWSWTPGQWHLLR